MAKNYTISPEEYSALAAAITEKIKGTKKNTAAGFEEEMAKALEAMQREDMQADLRDEWDKNTRTRLGDIVQNSTGNRIIDGEISPSEIEYGTELYNYVKRMLDAGLDPYSDPEIRSAVAEATNRGWKLPYGAGVDWDAFTRATQDEAYAQAIRDVYGDSPFNFGLDEEYIRANGLEGILDADTLARNSFAPLLREETEEERRRREFEAEQAEWDERVRLADALQNQKRREAEANGQRYYSGFNDTAPGYAQPAAAAEIARNGTTGWLSDEYEDVNTRTENPYSGSVQWTEEGQAYRDRLAGALGGASAPASGAAYQDYLAGLSAQGGASAGTGGTPSAGGASPSGYGGGYSGRSPSSGLSATEQQDAYRSMLDALVRGSNGGMPTKTGFTAANRINDQIGEITDPKPVYQKYANYGGNTLTRDKDYDYLNRLLKINK